MQHYSVVNKSSNSSSLYYMSTVPNSKCILLSLCNQPFSRSTVTESFLWLSTGISYLYFLSYHLVINLNLINTLQLLKILFFSCNKVHEKHSQNRLKRFHCKPLRRNVRWICNGPWPVTLVAILDGLGGVCEKHFIFLLWQKKYSLVQLFVELDFLYNQYTFLRCYFTHCLCSFVCKHNR